MVHGGARKGEGDGSGDVCALLKGYARAGGAVDVVADAARDERDAHIGGGGRAMIVGGPASLVSPGAPVPLRDRSVATKGRTKVGG